MLTTKRRYANTAARHAVPRIGNAAQPIRPTPITITDTVPGDTTVVTFDQAVILNGIPQWPNNSAHVPITAVLTAPNVLSLTYPAPDTTTAITVPFQEPAVRNGGGGFVTPGTFS